MDQTKKTPIPAHIERKKLEDTYFGRWDCGVPCLTQNFADKANSNEKKDFIIFVEEYIVEQSEYEIVNDCIILPAEFIYDETIGLRVPAKYNI